ncbi:transposase family protein [Nocardia lijiangensis]|uniref:transposase family protein n=1 Tax=Nocardia lijiangensis TaxID=299618 RepID=UPI0012DBE2A2
MVRIDASTDNVATPCPECVRLSNRVHSRYQRQLSDAAVAGREVLMRLRVRRLVCDNSDCRRRTFAKSVPGLAERHARRTTVLQNVLCAVALALRRAVPVPG